MNVLPIILQFGLKNYREAFENAWRVHNYEKKNWRKIRKGLRFDSTIPKPLTIDDKLKQFLTFCAILHGIGFGALLLELLISKLSRLTSGSRIVNLAGEAKVDSGQHGLRVAAGIIEADMEMEEPHISCRSDFVFLVFVLMSYGCQLYSHWVFLVTRATWQWVFKLAEQLIFSQGMIGHYMNGRTLSITGIGELELWMERNQERNLSQVQTFWSLFIDLDTVVLFISLYNV